MISSDELAAIQERLPEELKGDMDQVFRKRLEFEFHPAGYHVMLATTTGLRTAAGHLVKVSRLPCHSIKLHLYAPPKEAYKIVCWIPTVWWKGLKGRKLVQYSILHHEVNC